MGHMTQAMPFTGKFYQCDALLVQYLPSKESLLLKDVSPSVTHCTVSERLNLS